MIYIVFLNLSNLEMIESIWEDVPRLYVNSPPFYIRDLSMRGFGYLRGVLEPILWGYWGMRVTGFYVKHKVPYLLGK